MHDCGRVELKSVEHILHGDTRIESIIQVLPKYYNISQKDYKIVHDVVSAQDLSENIEFLNTNAGKYPPVTTHYKASTIVASSMSRIRSRTA